MSDSDDSVLLELRKKIFLAGKHAGMAHLASAYSSLEILYALYAKGIMRYQPENPEWEDRDLFVMSKGHGSLALYSVLGLIGVLPSDWHMEFARPGTDLGGEPSLCLEKGLEASTGSLGHGLSLATGMALGLKRRGSGRRVFVLVGDGECEEGSVWEAAIAAQRYGLGNLVTIIDCNGIQKMGPLRDVAGVDNWKRQFEDLGWNCIDVDGHNVDALIDAFGCAVGCGFNAVSDNARDGGSVDGSGKNRPTAIFAHTIKGKGVSIMEGNPAWHWRLPNKRETKVFAVELGISEEELESCKKHI